MPVLLVASLSLLAAAPAVLPTSYSWIEHTTSESAAQGVGGAWVARTGFGLFGLAVASLVLRHHRRWNLAAVVSHAVFAASMVVVAAFSTRSWVEGAAFDEREDFVHSVGATTMGFAFTVGVIACAVTRVLPRRFDVVAIAAATVLPVAMWSFESIDGALQRMMFAVAYLWYASADSADGAP